MGKSSDILTYKVQSCYTFAENFWRRSFRHNIKIHRALLINVSNNSYDALHACRRCSRDYENELHYIYIYIHTRI